MSTLDYLANPAILSALGINLRAIKNREDRDDCCQTVWCELYAWMPLDEDEAIRLVHRVARKFKRAVTDDLPLGRDLVAR